MKPQRKQKVIYKPKPKPKKKVVFYSESDSDSDDDDDTSSDEEVINKPYKSKKNKKSKPINIPQNPHYEDEYIHKSINDMYSFA